MSNGLDYLLHNEFPTYDTLQPKSGKNPEYHGHPNQGQRPFADDDHYYAGPGMIDPQHIVYNHHPDGFRDGYIFSKGVKYIEHVSGQNQIYHPDGEVNTIVGRTHHFHGGGEIARNSTGNIDDSGKGHTRENRIADHYENNQGSVHQYVGGQSITCVKGNCIMEVNRNYKLRVVTGSNGGISFSVGPGDKKTHDTVHSMTPERNYTRTNFSGDIWHDAGGEMGNINDQANMDHNTHAKQNVSIKADGDHVIVKGGKIYLDGDVYITGNIKIAKDMNSGTANVGTHYIGTLKVGSVGSGDGSGRNINAPAAKSLNHGTIT